MTAMNSSWSAYGILSKSLHKTSFFLYTVLPLYMTRGVSQYNNFKFVFIYLFIQTAKNKLTID